MCVKKIIKASKNKGVFVVQEVSLILFFKLVWSFGINTKPGR